MYALQLVVVVTGDSFASSYLESAAPCLLFSIIAMCLTMINSKIPETERGENK